MARSDYPRDPDNPLGWILEAACYPDEGAPVPLDALFVEAGHSISEETYQICEECPVRLQCLEYAYDEDITFGYFGGVSPSVRKRTTFAEMKKLIESDRIARGGRRKRS